MAPQPTGMAPLESWRLGAQGLLTGPFSHFLHASQRVLSQVPFPLEP